jgi:beta-phosphoglucomutase-like phosphatase (HAD superfamily)
MIKAVIFDVDGTLVDSVDLHARAWKRHSFSRNPHADRKGRRPTRAGVYEQGGIGQLRRTDLQAAWEIFKEKYLREVKAFPRVRDLFQRVLADGKKIALASSAIGEELETYKKVANIVDLLDAETSADDAEQSSHILTSS